jgi:hypothetical protein
MCAKLNELEPEPKKRKGREDLKEIAKLIFTKGNKKSKGKDDEEEDLKETSKDDKAAKNDKKSDKSSGPSEEELTNRNLYGGKDPHIEDSVTFVNIVQNPNSSGVVAQSAGQGGDLTALEIFANMALNTKMVSSKHILPSPACGRGAGVRVFEMPHTSRTSRLSTPSSPTLLPPAGEGRKRIE